jgi:hypothetical protein
MNARSKLIGKLDRLFSIIVRNRNSLDGLNTCYTCGQVLPIKELQCGHFLSRRYFGTRWNFDNARPQCNSCNVMKQGNLEIFEQELRNEIGDEKYNSLVKDAKKITKFSIFELYRLLLHFTKIVIEERINVKT